MTGTTNTDQLKRVQRSCRRIIRGYECCCSPPISVNRNTTTCFALSRPHGWGWGTPIFCITVRHASRSHANVVHCISVRPVHSLMTTKLHQAKKNRREITNLYSIWNNLIPHKFTLSLHTRSTTHTLARDNDLSSHSWHSCRTDNVT